MVTDLVQIRRLGEQARDENERFRRRLKRHTVPDKRFRVLAQEIEEQIDCRTCANCCRVATARLAERDVQRLARFLRVTPAAFVRDYTENTADEGLILKRGAGGCVFLSGSDCLVYEARPGNCQDFPHTVRGGGSVVSRMWDFKDRACYCPIVYNTLEAFKRETKFER